MGSVINKLLISSPCGRRLKKGYWHLLAIMGEEIQTAVPWYRRLRDARRGRGLTQHALAAQAGCQQSAISMLESGRPDAVARPTLERIQALLGVTVLAPEGLGDGGIALSPVGRPHCPSAACPSNVPFALNGEVIFWPRPQPGVAGRHCAYCGEPLARTCRQCGAAAAEGACCRDCGTAWVEAPAEAATDAEAWAERRRRQLAEWRALLAP
jgi:transcriptional regulator with XRE-family HTH domain